MKTITEYKNALKGLPKEEKINALQQEIANLTLFPGPPPGGTPKEEKHLKLKVQLKKLLKEIKLNPEAYESSTENKELLPFMYDRDLDWFYNAENIPNQDLVFATLEYFETGERIGIFEPLDFMNLFWKQFNFVKANIKKPHSTITTLKTLPLNPEEEHILFGFILKWFGGYPVENMNEQYNTTLRLIEREFLAFEGETPEKKFCQRNWKGYKRMKQIESFVNKNLNNVTTGLEYLENKEKDEIPVNQKTTTIKPEQEAFKFKNNFDHVKEEKVYKYFTETLVNPGYLSKANLENYLIQAFDKHEKPSELFTISNNPTIGTMRNIFYTYYVEVALKPHNEQHKYAGLLGEYFNGYNTQKVLNNFARDYQPVRK